MVLPPSTAAQSEAAEADWLTELRRWLALGRKGVIVMIRDAQRARLRELVLMLDEIEPGFCFDTDATVIADVAPGSLVLLGLQREQLDWLNLNRPVFAERSLRVVLWAEGDLAVKVKFHAPDLHDWISHFVTCPPGVPDFAVVRLAQGIRGWPGIAWTGPGLALALERVKLDACLELDPGQDYSQIIQLLRTHKPTCTIWKNVQTHTHTWRARLATTEIGWFTGTNILDNPSIQTPEWHCVNANQLALAEAVALISGDDRHRKAALAELNPEALRPTSARVEHQKLAPAGGMSAAIYHGFEQALRTAAYRGKNAEGMVSNALMLGQDDIAVHWATDWAITDPILRRHRKPPRRWLRLIVEATVIGEHTPAELPDFLDDIHEGAKNRFGRADGQYLFISRLLGLVAAANAHPNLAQRYLDAPAEVAVQGRYPLLAGAELEHSVVQTMLSRYESALAQFEGASAADPDYEHFERFHQLTRAALGQLRLEDADETPLSTRIQAEARRLLTSRLESLCNP